MFLHADTIDSTQFSAAATTEPIASASVELEQVKIAGRLGFFLDAWKEITSDEFILRTIQGYSIPLRVKVFQYNHVKDSR